MWVKMRLMRMHPFSCVVYQGVHAKQCSVWIVFTNKPELGAYIEYTEELNNGLFTIV